MYIVKFSVASDEVELIDYIKTQMGQDFDINKGIIGNRSG